MMNLEMRQNLQDLMDIRNQMDQYYEIGLECAKKAQLYQRYEKAKKRWVPENKKNIQRSLEWAAPYYWALKELEWQLFVRFYVITFMILCQRKN